MKQIPNLFTLLNLIFGCLAIIAILQNGIVIQADNEGTQYVSIPEKIWMASLFIGLAALVDFLDGFVARLFNASSAMGKQLDSLADVVSFGVAPSLIIYQFLRMSFASGENGIEISAIWLIPSLFIAAAAAYRLAKFNLDDSQDFNFKGLPTPAAGLLVASFPLIYWNTDNAFILQLFTAKWFLYGVIILLCWLMLSNISLMSMKFKDTTIKNNISKIILLAAAVIFALIFKWLAVPLVFILYIILSLAFKKRI
ncbi:MAG: CDP-alcohol phosphatidyltransferase family protein [Ferruginibacter sp.]